MAALLLVIGLFLVFLLEPLLHNGLTSQAFIDVAFRIGVSLSFLVPGLFRILHPTSRCKPSWRGVIYWLPTGALILLPLGFATLFIARPLGVFLLLFGCFLLVVLRLVWNKVSEPIPHASPARDVYNMGLYALARETDPAEKKKLSLALQRWKDSWRLK